MMEGNMFRMTIKTKIYLFFYEVFKNISQWFIHNCDYEDFTFSSQMEGEKEWVRIGNVRRGNIQPRQER
mgnify:CR=1 FL=1